MVYWLRRSKDFAKSPHTSKFQLHELAFIWLYVGALVAEYDQGFSIVKEDDFEVLCSHLHMRYDELTSAMQNAIPKDNLEWRTPYGVDWSKGMAGTVEGYVGKYVAIMEFKKKGATYDVEAQKLTNFC